MPDVIVLLMHSCNECIMVSEVNQFSVGSTIIGVL